MVSEGSWPWMPFHSPPLPWSFHPVYLHLPTRKISPLPALLLLYYFIYQWTFSFFTLSFIFFYVCVPKRKTRILFHILLFHSAMLSDDTVPVQKTFSFSFFFDFQSPNPTLYVFPRVYSNTLIGIGILGPPPNILQFQTMLQWISL